MRWNLCLLSASVIVALSAGSVLGWQETIAPVEPEIATAPVRIDGEELFRVRGVSSFPANTRARAISDQIKHVASDRSVAADSLRIVEDEHLTRIVAGDRVLMRVVDADGEMEQVSRPELARAHLARIRIAVLDYRAAREAGNLRQSLVNVLTATFALSLAVVFLRWFWRWLDRFMTRRVHRHLQTVDARSLHIVRADRLWRAIQGAMFGTRTLVFLGIGLAYVGYILGQFPGTRGLSRDMTSFAIGPLQVLGTSVVDSIPSFVFLTVFFFVVRLVLKIVRQFFDAIALGSVSVAGFEREWARPTYNLVRLAIVAFGLVVAYPYIPGSHTNAFKGVTLFLGIAFSLGSSSAIANTIAGYVLTYRRTFKIGDRVKIGDAVGDVIEIRLQVTRLRTPKNEELIIPNSQILNGEVLNYSSFARESGLVLHTSVGIGYETPWRQVETMLIMAAERTPGLKREPPPFVLQKALGDFAVTYELNAYCEDPHAMARLYADMHRHIQDVFNEHGVQIMTPAYESDPAQPKVVPPQAWYAAPASPPADQRARSARESVPATGKGQGA